MIQKEEHFGVVCSVNWLFKKEETHPVSPKPVNKQELHAAV